MNKEKLLLERPLTGAMRPDRRPLDITEYEGAGGYQARLARRLGNFDHAQPAGAIGTERRVIAQCRNWNALLTAGFQ